MKELLAQAGIANVHKVSERTTVITYASGGTRPATDTEKNLILLLAKISASR